MSLIRKAAIGAASVAIAVGITAGPAFAAHGGQYHATSQGNGKCHDTGRPGGTTPEPSTKGQTTAAANSETIEPGVCP